MAEMLLMIVPRVFPHDQSVAGGEERRIAKNI
jgi:hypothetical protein